MRVSHEAARVIHAVLPLVLLVGGAWYSADPYPFLFAFWELFRVICPVILVGAGIADALGHLACRRLQPHKTEAKLRVEEAMETTRAIFVFCCFAAWPRWLMNAGRKTAVVFSLAEAQPDDPENLPLYLVKLLFATALVDFYMYWKHRLLHTRPLFAFHAGHHHFHLPSPFAAFAVAPVEATLTFWPVTLLSLPQAPIWAHAYGCWVMGFVCLNLYLHLGFESDVLEGALRPLGLNSAAFHDIHHERGVINFGELGYVWDWALGTGSHPGKGLEGLLERRLRGKRGE